jgi:hypothetical protein
VFNVLSSATEARPAGHTRVLGFGRGKRKEMRVTDVFRTRAAKPGVSEN